MFFFGYLPASCATLEVSNVMGGTAPYTITVTDASGCIASADINVEVIDVVCGNNPNNPKVEIRHNGRTRCVSQNAVQAHLNHGDSFGSCEFADETFVT